jgi:hypothetical protein
MDSVTPESPIDPSPASSEAESETEEATVSGWRRIASIAGCWVLGLVLLVAAWAKSLDPIAFGEQITAEGLDFLLPASLVVLIALFLEWGLGAALLLAVRHRFVLWPSAALVAFFVFLTGRTYVRHLQGIEPEEGTSCGCFGNLVERTPTEAFWQDFFLMVPALLLAFLALDAGRSLPKKRLAVALAVALGMTLFAWKAPELPLDDLATRLKPGMEPLTHCAGSEEQGTRTCLDAVVPELGQGEHLVILADVGDTAFTDAIPQLNEYAWSEDVPSLWVLSDASEEALFELRFTQAPAFEIRETPTALMRPLYRTLPRSFRVSDGTVTATYNGLPPLGPSASE